ncbi:MAG TPA: helix-turn-helix domain-containing protein [Candidatus Limnocylindrales bacterium]|jgi:excisionase family DNA binding protein
MSAADTAAATEWLTIREASALVGVSVATLRRWCDAGRVHVFTTPGGHRRFDRADVMELLPAVDIPARLDGFADTSLAIVEGYRRATRKFPYLPRRLRELPEDERVQLRQHGRRIVAALVETLDAPSNEEAVHCGQARTAAAACGQIARRSGLSLQDTLALFVRFRAPFLHELGAVCRRRGLTGAAATALLERASDLMDRMLPAIVSGYEAAEARRP